MGGHFVQLSFSEEETNKILSIPETKERVILSDSERRKLFKKIHKTLGTDDYLIVKSALWELLKYMVSNSPDNVDKWQSVRWLLSELAKFAKVDYGKKISE